MTKKLRMAIDELERELSVITQAELVQLMGGNGSGLGMDASIDDVVNYLQDAGFPLEQDSSGNFFFNSSGNTILIDEVVIYAYSTGNSGYDGSSGNSSGIEMGDDPLSMTISYLQSYGYSFSYHDGNYTYYPQNSESSSNSSGDPWQRDANGDIVATPVEGKVTSIDYADYKITLQEVTITTKNGEIIIAYQVTEVIPTDGSPMSTIPDNFFSNCHGYAFGEGTLWFHDPFDSNLRDPLFNEMSAFENLFNQQNPNRLYNEVNASQAKYAAIWWTDNSTGERLMVHSAKVNSNGSFNQKNEYGSVESNKTYNDFMAGHYPSSAYSYEVVYYDRNY